MADKIKLMYASHIGTTASSSLNESFIDALGEFKKALSYLSENEGIVYTSGNVFYYKWIEKEAPSLFEKIREMIKNKRWFIVNTLPVAKGFLSPSGESLGRYCLYAQGYFYEKFGVTAKTCLSSSTFGNSNLPQIINLGGMDFCLRKSPESIDSSKAPKGLFWWDSEDSSRVLAYNVPDNLEELNKLIKKHHYDMLFLYSEKAPFDDDENKAENTCPDDYFKGVLGEKLDLPKFKGDINSLDISNDLPLKIKALMKKSERELLNSEKLDTISSVVTLTKPNTDLFKEAWERVLFNKCQNTKGNKKSFEEIEAREGYSLNIANEKSSASLLKIAERIDTSIIGEAENEAIPYMVFNPTSFEMNSPVKISLPIASVTDSDGNSVTFQNVPSNISGNESYTVFNAKVPPLGYNTFLLERGEDRDLTEELSVDEGFKMENEFISVDFDSETGYIKSLADKISGCEYGGENFLAIPTVIDRSFEGIKKGNTRNFKSLKGLMELVSIEATEKGALRSVVKVKHKFNESYLTEEYILYKGQKTLICNCNALWQESDSALKISFPIGGKDGEVTRGAPYSYSKNSCDGVERGFLDWVDLTVNKGNNKNGLSLISDSLCSFDCPSSELRLTALSNESSLDEGSNSFTYGIYLHQGKCEKSEIQRESEFFNNKAYVIRGSFHKGELKPKMSFIYTNLDNVSIKVLKRSDDGSGDLIIRLFETQGIEFSKGYIMSKLFDNGFWFQIGKNQIKTYRVGRDTFVEEVNLLEK